MRPPTIEQVELMLRAAIDSDDVADIVRLGRQLDELDAAAQQRRNSVTLLSAALWYAEHGLRVFPLMPSSKQPWPRSHGCRDATSSLDVVRGWWTRSPDSNIGIATGHVVDVIDIDGLRGNMSLCHLLNDNEHAVDHIIGSVSTPRAGGRHLYVPATGRGNGASLADGIDYRGAGGYVVAPPSRTENGRYQWTSPLDVERACQSVAS